jgi:N-acetylglucosamine-6-phosphate deacetylase
MFSIVNAKIVLKDSILENHVVLIQDDYIHSIITDTEYAVLKNNNINKEKGNIEEYDAKGRYLGPGLIDIHNHGADGVWFHEDPEKACTYHLKHGTTSILATTLIRPTHENMVDDIKTIVKSVNLMNSNASKTIIGIHIEGPYMNPKYGAFKEYSRLPVKKEYDEYLKEAEGMIKIWTIAPEMEGVTEFVNDVSESKKDEPIVFSAGHSEATTDMLKALLDKGLKLQTHGCCATGCYPSEPIYEGTKEVDFDHACWLIDDITIELIADSKGIHVREDMLKLIYKIKGRDRLVLVTDSTNFTKDNNSTDVNILNGTDLAGSALTLNVACFNMMKHTGISIADAFYMASYTPAKLLGIDNKKGSIEPEKKADLLLVDDKMNVHSVWLDGKLI